MFIKYQKVTSALILLIGFSFMGLLSSCGTTTSAATDARTITFWSSSSAQSTQKLIDIFNQQNQGQYHVIYNAIPYNNETEIVNSALTAHRGPDLLEESITTLATYASLGVVEPIEPFLQRAGINPGTDFPPSMWNDTALKGVHYTAPVDAIPTLLFYNKAMFRQAGLNPDQPPTNAQQFIHDAQLMTKASQGQWGYVQQPSWPNQFLYPGLLAQFGGQLADSNTRQVLFNSQAGRNALQFEWDTIFKYHVSPTNASPNEYYNLFTTNKNAMMLDGAYQYPLLQAALGKDLGVAQMPVIGNKQATFMGEHYWWVFKNAQMNETKQEGIARFMRFYYDHSMDVAKIDGFLPAWEPTLRSAAFQKLPGLNLQAQALAFAVHNPLIPNWGTTASPQYLYQNISLALTDKTSPDKALITADAQTQKEISALLA